MESELNKGKLDSKMQDTYLAKLQELSDYAFLSRIDYEDERLFSPTVYQPTFKPTTPVLKCPGSRVSIYLISDQMDDSIQLRESKY